MDTDAGATARASQGAAYAAVRWCWADRRPRVSPLVIFTAIGAKQCTSAAFASLASENGVTLSLGRTVQCWDKALSEMVFCLAQGRAD